MAVAALLIWLGTAAVGTYLLISGIQAGNRATGPESESASPEPEPVTVAAESAAPPAQRRRPDPFAPPTLQRAQAEPMPGLRDLAEFAHPALAVTGFGFWFGYVISRDLVFAAIGLGVLLGAVAAGVSWFLVNKRGTPASGGLRFTPRVLLLHAAGAALTLLLVALVTARV